jgi:flagellar export protein FliJ
MAFHFPLAAVLRYRESIEQREYFALEKIQQDIVRVELTIAQIESEVSLASQHRSEELARGMRAASVQSAYEYQKALEQQIEALQALLLGSTQPRDSGKTPRKATRCVHSGASQAGTGCDR